LSLPSGLLVNGEVDIPGVALIEASGLVNNKGSDLVNWMKRYSIFFVP